MLKYIMLFFKAYIFCRKQYILSWTLKNGKLNLTGDVYLHSADLSELPFTFGKVTGSFNCGWNDLTSIENFPQHIGNHLYCFHNKFVKRQPLYNVSVGGMVFSTNLWKF